MNNVNENTEHFHPFLPPCDLNSTWLLTFLCTQSLWNKFSLRLDVIYVALKQQCFIHSSFVEQKTVIYKHLHKLIGVSINIIKIDISDAFTNKHMITKSNKPTKYCRKQKIMIMLNAWSNKPKYSIVSFDLNVHSHYTNQR